MRGYVPQRQILPDMAASMSASLGWAFFAMSADADMIWPDWQYPHCTTSRSSHACCTFLPAGVSPIASMVVIFLPAAAATGVTHERVGWPSSCTVQAPHSAMPQPNFVPVRPTTSRSTHRIGMSDGTSTVTSRPLMFRVAMNDAPRDDGMKDSEPEQ